MKKRWNKRITVADYISEFLYDNNIKLVFGMIGGMVTHLVDAFHRNKNVKFIPMYHEQAAAFAAEAYARFIKTPGVAIATSGPGATNLITGIGSCYFDSSPTLFITGQVNTKEMKKDKFLRQQGFQETDIVALVDPITKFSVRVNQAKRIPKILAEALKISLEERPGPVLIDIPINVQYSTIGKPNRSEQSKKQHKKNKNLLRFVDEIYDSMMKSKRPIILVGGGIRQSNSRDSFLKWLNLINIPVVNSLMAVDVLPHSHPNRIGMIGSYGNRYANLAIKQADLLIVLGSRLDIRQTGSDVKAFSDNKVIYHVDCDVKQLNNRVKKCKVLNSHLGRFFKVAIKKYSSKKKSKCKQWRSKLRSLKLRYPDTDELQDFKTRQKRIQIS